MGDRYNIQTSWYTDQAEMSLRLNYSRHVKGSTNPFQHPEDLPHCLYWKQAMNSQHYSCYMWGWQRDKQLITSRSRSCPTYTNISRLFLHPDPLQRIHSLTTGVMFLILLVRSVLNTKKHQTSPCELSSFTRPSKVTAFISKPILPRVN